MKQILFIADDFGRSTEINQAIIEAHQRGALQGASLMVGQPGSADAVRLARANPRLLVGWHLHLDDSQPVTRATWPWGNSSVRAGLRIGLTPSGRRLMKQEVAGQWAEFVATGLACEFVNTHHHLHTHPAVWRELKRTVPGNFGGWVRLGTPQRFADVPALRSEATRSTEVAPLLQAGHWFWKRRRQNSPWPASDTLWGLDRLRAMQADEVRAALGVLEEGRHEFMFHPGRTEGDADFAALIALRGAV